MKNLHVHCLAFNTLDLVEASLIRFDEHKPKYPITTKLLVDQSWPITNGSSHSDGLRSLAANHGWHYIKPFRNRGVGGSWNWVVKELDLGDNDIIWGADPDEQPQSKGYLDAAMSVFNNATECYTVQMNQARGEYLTYPREEFTIGGEQVLKFHQAIAWSLGGFSVTWLNRIGGFLQSHPIYGHCETAIYNAATPLGGRFYILKYHYNVHLENQEPLFKQWKIESAHFQTQLSFADWVRTRP